MYDEWILRSLRRIIRAVDLHSKQLQTTHQLTVPQLICLRAIESSGPLKAGQLANDVSLSPATITGIVDRLEQRELARRRRSETDRRQVLLEITDRGREVLASAPPSLNERFSRGLARLTEHEQADIERVLQRVVSLMEADDLDAAPVLTPSRAPEPVAASTPGTATARAEVVPITKNGPSGSHD